MGAVKAPVELSLQSLNRHHLHHHGGVLGEDLGQRLLQVGGPGWETDEGEGF